MSRLRVVVLISGNGSNLQALIDASKRGEMQTDIVGVISNKAEAYGLKRAELAGIATQVVNHRLYTSRSAYDQVLAETIQAYNPDLIVLAGFMRIFTQELVTRFIGRMLNIHPALLPKYPGLHTHQQAVDAGDKEHGASVHFVIPELDAGPVIVQGRFKLNPGDNAEDLAAKTLPIEHRIYAAAVGWFAEGRVEYRNNEVFFDGKTLSKPIQL